MGFVQVFVVCCFIGTSLARSDQDIKRWFLQKAVECSKDIPVTGEQLAMMNEHKIPDNKNAKCVVACIFKKMKWIDDEGKFNESSAIEFSDTEYADNPTKLENAKKLYETCRYVNDEAVEDGDSGCERSAMLATCFTDHAPKMGFSIM